MFIGLPKLGTKSTVSQICNLTGLLPAVIIFEPNSTPIVLS